MYEVVALICIVIFFQIVIYKIGYMQGERAEIKNELVGKTDKFNSCKKCNSSEKSNS